MSSRRVRWKGRKLNETTGLELDDVGTNRCRSTTPWNPFFVFRRPGSGGRSWIRRADTWPCRERERASWIADAEATGFFVLSSQVISHQALRIDRGRTIRVEQDGARAIPRGTVSTMRR